MKQRKEVTMIKLLLGDCLEILPTLERESIDMVLTDLPYQITQCKWDSMIDIPTMWQTLEPLLKDNTPILMFGNEPFSSMLRLSNPYYKYDIIWDKEVRTGHLNAKKQPMRQYENIMFFYNKQCTYNPIMWKGKEENHNRTSTNTNPNVYNDYKAVPVKFTKNKYPTNIIKFNAKAKECNGQNRVHPTQKPVDLLKYLIKTYSNEGDTVLDFTMGSGSTGVACLETNRNFIGIELDEHYYEIAKERCSSFQSSF